MLIKIGGISSKDYDDFYSIALSVLADVALKYDEDNDCDFDGFWRAVLIENLRQKSVTVIEKNKYRQRS